MEDEFELTDERTGTGKAPRRVRVMVAIGVSPSTDRLVRRAKKLADGLDGELFALHIHPRADQSNVSHANVEWHLARARQLGAHVHVVQSADIAGALVEQARTHGITHLVLGQSDISRWQEVLRGSIINRILRYRSGIDLYIVTDPER